MKPAPFEYFIPDSIEQALELRRAAQAEAAGAEQALGQHTTTFIGDAELDLGEMFQALFDAFGEMGSEAETTDTTPAVPELEFVISVKPSKNSNWNSGSVPVVCEMSPMCNHRSVWRPSAYA